MQASSKNTEIINALNTGLKMELTAVHQYLYHATMLREWGIDKLAEFETKEAAEETAHSNTFGERILFLGGEPDYQSLDNIAKASSVKAVIENDLEMELAAVVHYRSCIKLCLDAGDYGTQDVFMKILVAEEMHVEHLEKQLGLIKSVGIENYILSWK